MQRIKLLLLLLLLPFLGLQAQGDVVVSVTGTTPVSCGGGADGSISIAISGGVGEYHLLLLRSTFPAEAADTYSNTYTFSGHIRYGSYLIIVSDDDPLTLDGYATNVAITGPDAISVDTYSSNDISCNGFNDGQIIVTASGEQDNLLYTLSGPDPQSNASGIFTGLSAGDHVVTVSDADGCPSTDATPTMTITNPTPISIAIDGTSNIDCFGDNTGAISVSPSGGTPGGGGTGYTYSWSGPNGFSSSSEDISSLEAGDYSLTVFDQKMCSAAAGPITLSQNAEITASLNSSSDVSCNGGNDGSATITASGGNGPLSYSWDGQTSGFVSTDQNPINLPADTYDLTIFDGTGCSVTFTAFAVIDEPDAISAVVSNSSDVLCNGGNDGSVEITVSGGSPGYTFLWTGALSGYTSVAQNPNDLPADVYSLQISDASGCTANFPDLLTINEPMTLSMTLDGSSDVSCNGLADGSAEITINGGTPLYTVLWTGDVSGHTSGTEDPLDLVADTYDLDITDANGCFASYNNLLVINEPAAIGATVDLVTHVDCNGQNTGAIDITPTGGTPPYSFAWTGPGGFSSTDEDISNLEAGSYSVQISDANGCFADFTDLATVNTNTPITASFILSNPSCAGMATPDGSINVTVSGGVPNYSYSWDVSVPPTPILTEDISNAGEADYTLTVTDNLGCVQSFPTQSLVAPPAISASATSTDIACFGDDDGSIDLTATGGTGSLSFSWTGPNGFTSSNEDLSGLEPGAYSVTISDTQGCSQAYPDIVSILESPEILASALKTDIACFGAMDGTIDLTVSGGAPPYLLNWTGPNGFTSTDEDLSGLDAGNYNLRVTDGNGCVVDFPNLVSISTNLPINASFALTHPRCAAMATPDGAIDATVSGGVPGYSFNWDVSIPPTPLSTEDISNAAAGDYTLTVTDAAGCVQSFPTQSLIEPPAITAGAVGTDIDCFGDDDGSIDLTAGGGTGTLNFSWTGPNGFTSSDEDLSGLEAGSYSLSITDANLCTEVYTDLVTINESPEITATALKTDIDCFGAGNGSIDLTLGGGVPPYVVAWSGPDGFTSSSEDISNLEAGSYDLSITDANACVVNFPAIAVINEPAGLSVTLVSQVNLDCFGDNNGSAEIDVNGGTGPYTFDWTDESGLSVSADEDPGGLRAGTYSLGINDGASCQQQFSDLLTITQPEALEVELLLSDPSCNGGGDGQLIATGSKGSGSIEYSLNGGAFQASGTFSGLSAGPQSLQLRDANSCLLDTSFSLSDPLPITIDSETSGDISCNGAGDGSIEIIASGGTAPLNFTLNPGALTQASGSFSGLNPGTYTVEVSDSKACGPAISSPLVITEPTKLLLDSVHMFNTLCNGGSDGVLEIFVSGGTRPYEFSSDNGASWQSDSVFTGLPADNYEVYARDANLCQIYVGSASIGEPAALRLVVGSDDVTGCAGDSSGAIYASGSGGTGLLEYSLDDVVYQSSGTFTNLPAGDFSLFLRDENACSISQPVSLSEPEPVFAEIVHEDASFDEPGSITIGIPTGGLAPYRYSIDSGANYSYDLHYPDLEEGDYYVFVEDINGCTYEELITIMAFIPLTMDTVILGHISCFGAADGSIVFDPLDAVGVVDYSIDGGSSFVQDSVFSDLDPGSYFLYAVDEDGKTFADTVEILEPAELSLTAMVTDAECNVFSETGIVDVDVSGGTPGYAYLWSDGRSDEDRDDLAVGKYTLVVTDANDCFLSDSFDIAAQVIVEVSAGTDTTVCPGVEFMLEGSGNYSPSWSNPALLDNPDTLYPTVLGIATATEFVLTISEDISGYGCFNMDTVLIDVHPLSGLSVSADTFVIRGESARLESFGGPFTSYHWTPATGLDDPDIPDPLATPLETTTYLLTVINDLLCTEQASVLVEVIDGVRAYNVFTPGGDGYNDFFEIENGERFPDMVVEVYNRWGDLLYSGRGYDESMLWDGTARGKKVPTGTYYYVLVPYPGAKAVTGNVTVIWGDE